MAPAPAWAFVYQEGSLRLAPQALGALQVPLLSPRLPLGAVCPASDIPFESISRRGVGWYDAAMGSFAFAEVVVWALLPLNPAPCHFWSHPAPLCLAKLSPKSQAWLFQCSQSNSQHPSEPSAPGSLAPLLPLLAELVAKTRPPGWIEFNYTRNISQSSGSFSGASAAAAQRLGASPGSRQH